MGRTDPAASPTVAIFDLDGVLVDLPIERERVRRRIEAAVAAALGAPRTLRPLLRDLDRAIAALADRDAAAAGALRQQAWDIIDDEERQAAPRAWARPGATALLSRLGRLSVPVALYTNNARAAAMEALAVAGLEPGRFFRVEARDGAGAVKPAAEPLVRIVEAAPVFPGRAVFTGDHPYDVESAARAQDVLGPRVRMVPVALRNPRTPDSALHRPGFTRLVDHLDEVLPLIVPASDDARV